MRGLVLVVLAACSNDVEPRVIPGGGVGDGDIDGEVNVFVVDGNGDVPIGGATVEVKGKQQTTDSKGLTVFKDVEGEQTVIVKASGYRSEMMIGVNGANVTIAMQANDAAPDSATLSGTISGWDSISVPTGHVKAAVILYSQSPDLGDEANELQTPAMGNLCVGGTACNWNLVSRTGTVTVIAAIVDRDGKGTPLEPNDDTQEIIGWAYKARIAVEKGVNQSGLQLVMVETGNLETMTIDQGEPPAGLTEVTCIPGVEVTKDEIVQLPAFINTDPTTVLAPKRTVFGADATYRLTAVAQTTSMGMGAQSIVLRQGMTVPDLSTGAWLVPPTGVEITRTGATWSAVSSASIHSVVWGTGQEQLLQITVLTSKTTSVSVPSLVALPSSGTLVARLTAVGSDLDLNDFSLEDDSGLIWGASTQPVSIP